MKGYRCWAEIDLAALERNIALIRKTLSDRIRYVSVVKADAYGHGILPTTARLMQSGVDLFAVANVKEAAEIREMASGWPILVLGPLLEEEDEALLEYDLIATVSSSSEFKRFGKLARKNNGRIRVHLKLDTGMGRLGVWWEEASELIKEIKASKEIELCGLLTHFAEPDDFDFTLKQRDRFTKVFTLIKEFVTEDFLIHADNSSSFLSLDKESIFNAIRVGLLQFGIAPNKKGVLSNLNVEPVLSFHSRLAMMKRLPEGTTISYGREHTLRRDSMVGIISAGYGDAIPLHCGNQASALVRGRDYPIIGRVTMDQTLVDLTDGPPDLAPGEKITLIGKQLDSEISLSTLAEHANTIPWELLCSITKRVPRIYSMKRE